jgi:hypothetical protein
MSPGDTIVPLVRNRDISNLEAETSGCQLSEISAHSTRVGACSAYTLSLPFACWVRTQRAKGLLVALAVDQPGNLPARFPTEPQKRLAQLQPVLPREPADVLHRPQRQVRIGRMRHRLGLHRGVDRDPLAGLRAQRAARHRHAQTMREH